MQNFANYLLKYASRNVSEEQSENSGNAYPLIELVFDETRDGRITKYKEHVDNHNDTYADLPRRLLAKLVFCEKKEGYIVQTTGAIAAAVNLLLANRNCLDYLLEALVRMYKMNPLYHADERA